MTKPHYYFAYGSNLNRAQMRVRCPGATGKCRFELEGYRLVFRGVADIVPADGQIADGALYTLTAADEAALDRYEGYRASSPEKGMYRKVTVESTVAGESATVMFYVMNSSHIAPPDPHYFDVIRQGYIDWQIDEASLREARRHSEQRYQEATI